MPTNRKRQTRNLKPVVENSVQRFLETGVVENDDFEAFQLLNMDGKLKEIWDSTREDILREWLKKHPCSRPWCWWQCEAPKEPIEGWDHERWHIAKRQRLGGVGTPEHEVTLSWGGFCKGIPESWVAEWQVEYYNGQAKDVHGNLISTEYKEGDFLGVAIDPNNPPVFESEAAYLDRHRFLSVEEKKFLVKHPELMEPEVVME